MIRVLVGAHGTGKTTLCNAMHEKYGCNVFDGVSRPVKKCKKLIGFDDRAEQIIINEMMMHSWRMFKEIDGTIMSRSPIDTICYSRVFGMNDLADQLEKEFIESDPFNEDIVYYRVPIEFELEDDGTRFMDPELQKKVDIELRRFCKKYRIHTKLLQGTVDQRLAQLIYI